MQNNFRTFGDKTNQLDRYLLHMREEINRRQQELMEKESHLEMVQETVVGLRRAYKEIQTVHELSNKMVAALRNEQIIAGLFGAIGEILPLVAGAFLRFDALTDSFSLVESQNLVGAFREEVRNHQHQTYYRWVLRERHIVVLPETVKFEVPVHNEYSCILLPVSHGKELVGLVDIFIAKMPEEFTQRDFDLLTILTNQATVALLNARLYQDMELKTEAIFGMKNFMTNILESMSSGCVAVDMQGRITLLNNMAEKMLGITVEDPIGSSILEALPSSMGDKIIELFQQMIQKDKDSRQEIVLQDMNEKGLSLSVTCSQLLTESGELAGVIFLLQNISASLELMNLRKLDQMKDQLISAISHELRTPITIIKSFSEILLTYDDNDAATRDEFLRIISAESDRLTTLIANVIDLSNIEMGNTTWELGEISIGEVVELARDTVERMAKRKDLHIEISAPDDLPKVWGDHDKIEQVLINLLTNAIKFSPEQGIIRICVDILNGEDNPKSHFVQIGIHDQGPGISEEHLDSIFEKFTQIPNIDDGFKPAGLGLGLAISKSIVTNMSGKIWVSSKPNAGTSFYFTLPAYEAHRQADEESYPSLQVQVVDDVDRAQIEHSSTPSRKKEKR